MTESKDYVAEYVIDCKDSSRKVTLKDAELYFRFLLKYLNQKQNKFTVETLLESRLLENQLHIFVKIHSHVIDINGLFEYMNSQCSMAYVEVMTDDNEKLWADISRLYQLKFFNHVIEEKKKEIAKDIQDDEGWIPLEKLKEAIIKNHIVINEEFHGDPWEGAPVKSDLPQKDNEEKNEESNDNNT